MKNEISKAEAYELRIQDSQHKWIKEEFNKKTADNANYGWSIDGSGKNASIGTKIYGKGVLTSYYRKGVIEHDFSDNNEES